MRLTRLRACNLLTFDDFRMDFTQEPLSVLVGPNGAGKTNVFRIVHLVLGAVGEGLPGLPFPSPDANWLRRLQRWARGHDRVRLELGITLNDDSEQTLVQAFV
jgi:energy-coupling factor transporter ATP-binding protein EcfA2